MEALGEGRVRQASTWGQAWLWWGRASHASVPAERPQALGMMDLSRNGSECRRDGCHL